METDHDKSSDKGTAIFFEIQFFFPPAANFMLEGEHKRGCIQKFPDWPPGARTANGTALCH
jgi:hypothetical protein